MTQWRVRKNKMKMYKYLNPLFILWQMFRWQKGNRYVDFWMKVREWRMKRGTKVSDDSITRLATNCMTTSRAYKKNGVWCRPLNQFKVVGYKYYSGYGRLEIIIPRFALNG